MPDWSKKNRAWREASASIAQQLLSCRRIAVGPSFRTLRADSGQPDNGRRARAAHSRREARTRWTVVSDHRRGEWRCATDEPAGARLGRASAAAALLPLPRD